MKRIEHQRDWQRREVDQNEEEKEVAWLVEEVASTAYREAIRQRMGPTEHRPYRNIEITLRREAVLSMHEPGEDIKI